MLDVQSYDDWVDSGVVDVELLTRAIDGQYGLYWSADGLTDRSGKHSRHGSRLDLCHCQCSRAAKELGSGCSA